MPPAIIIMVVTTNAILAWRVRAVILILRLWRRFLRILQWPVVTGAGAAGEMATGMVEMLLVAETQVAPSVVAVAVAENRRKIREMEKEVTFAIVRGEALEAPISAAAAVAVLAAAAAATLAAWVPPPVIPVIMAPDARAGRHLH